MIKKERYFHASDVVRAEFYQFYAVLLDSPTYAELSNDSRVLYAVLQKRLQLSMKNGWLDEEGRTYFTSQGMNWRRQFAYRRKQGGKQ